MNEEIVNRSTCPIIIAGALIVHPGQSIRLPQGMFERLEAKAADPGADVIVEVWPDNVVRFAKKGE